MVIWFSRNMFFSYYEIAWFAPIEVYHSYILITLHSHDKVTCLLSYLLLCVGRNYILEMPCWKTYAVSRKDIEDSRPVATSEVTPFHHWLRWWCWLLQAKGKRVRIERSREEKLNVLMDDVGELKNAISDMLTLNKEARIPLGLHRLLHDTLKCKICLSVPMTPPQ